MLNIKKNINVTNNNIAIESSDILPNKEIKALMSPKPSYKKKPNAT